MSFAFSSKLPGDAVAAGAWIPRYIVVADDTHCHSLPLMEASVSTRWERQNCHPPSSLPFTVQVSAPTESNSSVDRHISLIRGP